MPKISSKAFFLVLIIFGSYFIFNTLQFNYFNLISGLNLNSNPIHNPIIPVNPFNPEIYDMTTATSQQYAWNYDDAIPEHVLRVCDNSSGDWQSLGINFNLGQNKVIIKGVQYFYNNSGAGPTH
ncbi:MAG: hypothetical protein ACFFDN_13465, partial [Candidatus Hodarchaeota archaeon]